MYTGVCKYYVSIRGWKPASSEREWETVQKWEWERQREINRIRPHSLTGRVTEEQLWLCTWLCIPLSACHCHNTANTPPFTGSAHCTTGLRQNFLAHWFVYTWHLLWIWAEFGPSWTSEYSCVWSVEYLVFWRKLNWILFRSCYRENPPVANFVLNCVWRWICHYYGVSDCACFQNISWT